jgi:hypothetical protein
MAINVRVSTLRVHGCLETGPAGASTLPVVKAGDSIEFLSFVEGGCPWL